MLHVFSSGMIIILRCGGIYEREPHCVSFRIRINPTLQQLTTAARVSFQNKTSTMLGNQRHGDRHKDAYTVLSRREQNLILILLGISMLVSPLTATIYFPLLPLLATHFHTSAQAINLTITVYIVFQALSPLFLASTPDHFGRRPIIVATFALYAMASLGLALNKSSYPALLVLRAIQSLGASAVLSISYGAVADICVPAKRGKMLGPMLAAGNVGTCIGPI